MQFSTCCVFQRTTLNEFGQPDVSRITAHFHAPSVVVTPSAEIDLNAIVQHFNERVDGFTKLGSGYILEYVDRLSASFVKFRPLGIGAGSYIPLPTWLKNKKACINPKNYSDQKCFIWSILAHVIRPKDNADRLRNYVHHENMLNVDGLSFPMSVKDIPRFEAQNRDFAIHVISPDEKDKSFSILYLSPHAHQRRHIITLLLLDHPTDNRKKHFVYVKNLSRLVADRSRYKGASHVCLSCLQVFSCERVLRNHERHCLVHKPQMITFPDPDLPDQCKLSFNRHQYEHEHDFYLVCDFEACLVKNDDASADPTIVNRHEMAGYCLHRMTKHENYQTQPKLYSGPAAIEHFFDAIFSEADEISQILSVQRPMLPLTDDQRIAHDNATACQNCKTTFSVVNPKCHHHNHVSGRYLFPACQHCNLALKPRKCSDGYVCVCIFHNLKAYDSNFILKHFDKKYVEYNTKRGAMAYRDIEAIPINSEKTLQFQIRNVIFADSCEFLSASLDTLVSTLKKGGTDLFVETRKYLGDSDLIFQKGHFPYTYFDSLDRLRETELPEKSKFYNDLTESEIDDRQYQHAWAVWRHFDMKSFKDYHDHYMKSDVLLLSDCFQNFRQTMISTHGLDCLYFPSLPSMALQVALKMTEVELDLITEADQYLLLESNIRGGLSYVAERYAKANDPSLPDFDPERPISSLLYVDANSLYASSQICELPVGNFRFLTSDEIENFDVMSIRDDSPTGYVVECDLLYPASLHKTHSAYPLCPDHVLVEESMLSPTVAQMHAYAGTKHTPCTKLINDLNDKEHYVTHYKCLKFYLSQGMQLAKIHRIISFSQSAFMRRFIDYCNTHRQNAKTEFESSLYKLLPNAVFGKTCENLRKRVNLRLVTDPKKLVRAAGKSTYKKSTIINSDLVLVESARAKIFMNRPLIVGFTILEMAKLQMYRFYYEVLLPKYGEKMRLLFTDTDSFILLVETLDLHADMAGMMEWFDTSNFPTDHPLYSTANKRKLGFFKSETGAHCPSEFCGLRSKMYSLWTPTSDDDRHTYVKAKGIPKAHVKQHVRHHQYLHVLNSWSTTRCKFRAFRSTNHEITTREFTKVCLSALDDKRYLLSDGVTSLAYGHCDIP